MPTSAPATPPPERSTDAIRAAVWLGCILAGYLILRPIRDAMGAAGGVAQIKWLWNGTFVATLLLCPLFAWAAARLPRRRLVAATYHAVVGALLLFYLAWRIEDPSLRLWVGRVFYVFVSVVNLLLISVFWSAVTDLHTTAGAVRRFGPIAVGGTIGAIVGSTLTTQLVETIGSANLLLVSAGLLELGLLVGLGLLSRSGDDPLALTLPRGRAAWRDIRSVLTSPMLRALAAYVLLMTWPITVLYLEKVRLVADSGLDRDGQTALFARVDLWTQGFTVLMQLFLTGPLIRRFGLGISLAVLPAVCVLGFGSVGTAALIGVPIFWIYVVSSAVLDATRHAVQKPSREVLFTLAPPHERYAAKNAIDTLVHRGGDVLSAFTHTGVKQILPTLGGVLLSVVPVAVVWGLLARRLGSETRD